MVPCSGTGDQTTIFITDPSILEEFENQNDTYRVAGEIPYKTGEDAEEWFAELNVIAKEFWKNDSNIIYKHPCGPVNNIEAHPEGYIFVGLDSRSHIIDEDLNDIVREVSKTAEQHGINNVPIVIGVTPYGTTDIGIPEKYYPPTKPSYFENLSGREGVLKTSGLVPEKERGKEAYKWNQKLSGVVNEVGMNKSFEKYRYPNGPIGAFFVDYDTVLIFIYDDYGDITDQELNDITNMVIKTGEKKGVRNVPIAIYGNNTIIGSGPVTNESDTNGTDSEDQNENIPGFGITVSLLGFVLLIGLVYIQNRSK
ncbi:hypothetical protein [Methanolapillus africanus]|uniref:hypothetical protein n=1 Tax=Methanolapillus africanus TaxID=3028297 RepID=UPI0030B8FDCC